MSWEMYAFFPSFPIIWVKWCERWNVENFSLVLLRKSQTSPTAIWLGVPIFGGEFLKNTELHDLDNDDMIRLRNSINSHWRMGSTGLFRMKMFRPERWTQSFSIGQKPTSSWCITTKAWLPKKRSPHSEEVPRFTNRPQWNRLPYVKNGCFWPPRPSFNDVSQPTQFERFLRRRCRHKIFHKKVNMVGFGAEKKGESDTVGRSQAVGDYRKKYDWKSSGL